MMNVMHSHNTIHSVLCNLSGTRFLHFVNRKTEKMKKQFCFSICIWVRERESALSMLLYNVSSVWNFVCWTSIFWMMSTWKKCAQHQMHIHREKKNATCWLSFSCLQQQHLCFFFSVFLFLSLIRDKAISNTNGPLQILAHFIFGL